MEISNVVGNRARIIGFTTAGGRPQQKVTLDGPPLGLSKPCEYVYLSSDASHAARWFIDGWFALMVGLLCGCFAVM